MPDTQGRYVLVVEDGVFMRQLLQGLLTRMGYEVVTVPDGVEAISQMQKAPPAVVLLDLEIPKLSGEQVCRWIRRHRQFRDLPVIACTAHSDRDKVVAAIKAGVTDYLCKPVDRKRLQEKLEKHLPAE